MHVYNDVYDKVCKIFLKAEMLIMLYDNVMMLIQKGSMLNVRICGENLKKKFKQDLFYYVV